ncbi:phosphonate ABC transporter, permease protein PhnE [Myceligenerans salitolerans]|uniref:Phosphonate ABC transporter, permease protein PhnE n=1 Tax=Myceligenerans salitolerans TaxID=1230528 RepID=A0ABS3I4D8_9MICO|nr:phosphonate ABC transporter, permease protein PhnE [Myceligenerans salitolerans]MBO0607854.1 phosphonate ABC transporter, permease protein PhnE [Myceligenerans salitolerans]
MTATTTVPAPGRAVPPKPRPPWGLYAGLIACAVVTVWAALGIEFTLAPLFSDLTRGREVVAEFFRPDWEFAWRVREQWLETLQLAVVAGSLGCLLALVLAHMASDVTAPPWMARTLKALLAVERSLPDVAWALLAVAVVGNGALAGILALFAFNVGVAAKLTAESVDAVDRGPVEAATAVGASAVQRAVAAVLPQVMPNFLSYSFYVFELNIRASLVIGLVGAGGIGQVIKTELSRFQYSHISAIVAVFVVVVFVLDQASAWLRRRLI